MTRGVLLITLLFLTMPIAGCIGDDGSTTDPTSQSTPATGELPATAAVFHRSGANTTLPATAAELTLPVGLALGTGSSAFEPTLGVTSDGALFMSNLGGELATGYSSIVRSTDQGRSWEDVTPSIGPISSPPQSNDPYVHVDQATDRIYNLDMQGLNCNWIQWSDDGGESWMQNPAGCGLPPVLDHPTLFTGAPRTLATVGYENVVYLCVNRVADAACATSLDGGRTFTPFKTVFPEPGPEAESCGGLHGHGVTGPEGRAYLGKVHCGVPTVAVSEDDGLTWSTHVISEDHPSTRHDVELATDAAGNVYAFWVDEAFDPYLSVSTDHGRSWSTPQNVAHPDVETAVFPAIAAGDAGKVALVYIGTNATEDIGKMNEAVTWNAYLATLTETTSADPVIATSQLNPPGEPIARGPCDDDNRCDGIGDFIDLVIDADGRPWAALVDVCHDDCDAKDGNDQALGAVGTLSQGFPLRGNATSLPVIELPGAGQSA